MGYIIIKPATVEDIQDFISWLETQSGTYDSQDIDNCPIAKYLRARGHTQVSFQGMYELMADGNYIDLPKSIGEIIYETTEHWKTSTYKGALERARKLYVDMIYAIKPSEDPGAANAGENFPHLTGSGGFDVTGIQGPEDNPIDDPNLPTDDD